MKFVNTKSFYKAALRRYGGLTAPANSQTPWGGISYPLKFVGVNLRKYFLFEYRNGSSTVPEGTSVYIRNYKQSRSQGLDGINFLCLSANQTGIDFLEKIYQSQKTLRHE
jgi:hypothetical protein